MGMLRILRCNPLFKGGVDPVPEQFKLFPRRKKNCPDEKTGSFLDIEVK